jgi:hypothetical protein
LRGDKVCGSVTRVICFSEIGLGEELLFVREREGETVWLVRLRMV